ncbi:MAG: hypothetical protein CL472_07310 [Acidobacteria bacterium]|nr:hypothetical protein [Acidobacteriota bacterium]
MKALSVISFAVQTAITTGKSFVAINAITAGGSNRISAAFPTLDEDALETLVEDEFVIIEFNEADHAMGCFEQIIADLKAESTLVAGEVYFMTPDSRQGFTIG